MSNPYRNMTTEDRAIWLSIMSRNPHALGMLVGDACDFRKFREGEEDNLTTIHLDRA